jgi:hypothetical protein
MPKERPAGDIMAKEAPSLLDVKRSTHKTGSLRRHQTLIDWEVAFNRRS